jgi:glycosidase
MAAITILFAMKTIPKLLQSAVIYEMNVRQITPSGTFDAARAELYRLRRLGVDIVWVMPIQPIGKAGRKGTLGSYYAISDYTGFNPEFGTREDFQRFVDDAHALGMLVLLDWVANHTAPDHPWTQNPQWHKRRPDGSIAMREDWTDVAELNYDCPQMRAAMLDAMKFWLRDIKVDGFRCDMAMLVPVDFWEHAAAQLRLLKPDLIMLAEAQEPALMHSAFDIYYAWEMHHAFNDIAQGKTPAYSLWTCIEKQSELFPSHALPLLFTSNHDENSWNGTEFERMGEGGAMSFAALTFFLKGIPLIYTGQDTGSHHRLAFFEKDNIERRRDAPQAALYPALCSMRRSASALGSHAQMTKINNSAPQYIFSAMRQDGASHAAGLFNLSNNIVDVRFDEELHGEYRLFNKDENITIRAGQRMQFDRWEYLIGLPLRA